MTLAAAAAAVATCALAFALRGILLDLRKLQLELLEYGAAFRGLTEPLVLEFGDLVPVRGPEATEPLPAPAINDILSIPSKYSVQFNAMESTT